MSIIIRDGTNAGHQLAIDASGNASVVISGSIAAGSNLIGQVEISDGTNVLGTVAHPVVTSSAPASDRTATGTIASSPVANVAISTQGGGTVLFNITGTWSGTITFEASVDGTNWSTAVALPKYPSGAAAASSTTTNGNWAVNVGGLNMFRVRGSAWTSGTATIWLEVGQATNVQEVFQYFASNLNMTDAATSATGSPVPALASFIGGTDGTNLRGFNVDSSGQLKVLVQNSPSVTVSGTVTANQGTPNTNANGWPVKITDGTNVLGTNANPVRIDPTGTTTQPVSFSGNVTVVGNVASGSADSNNPVKTGAVFNTTQPTVTNGQRVDNQATARGALIVATGVDGFNVTNAGTFAVQVTGTVAVTQSTSPWVVAGNVASGAADAGNPVKAGGVFNTTQPTVTNGQRVDNQATARGAQIVATGVDTFNVTINTALPAGTNVIGHVITDSGSTTTVTGTVTVSGTVTANAGTGTFNIQSNASVNLNQVAGTALGATAVTNFGTAPAAAAVQGVNASIYAGTSGLTATSNALDINLKTSAATVTVTGTVAATQSGNWTTRIVGNTGATLDGTVAAGTAPTNGVAVLGQFNTTIPALTAAQTVAIQTDVTGAQAVNTEGRKQTYRVGVVAFTPIASATAPTISITGSATKTVRITRIVFSASAATGTISDVQLRRYSALSGGTANSQAANVAKMDTNNAAQTAVVNQWSAAATTATSAGILNAKRYELVTAAVSVQPGEIEWKSGDDNGQAFVLRGTGDFIGLMISAVGTTPLADCWVEWTEE